MDQKSPEGLSHQPQLSSKPYNHSVKQAENASDGIKNNDLFELPTSDFKMIGLLTLLAAVVRLFKIYQPSSVVFDEVQSVHILWARDTRD